MPVIYIDVLLALNLWIDFILLLATARILRLPRRRWRMVLGALLGAATSCLIFLPDPVSYTHLPAQGHRAFHERPPWRG